jgi:DNA-binding transcriptional ArsR family regulator
MKSESRKAADSSILAVLADPTRQAMLELLRGGPMRVGELADHLPVSRPAVSQHLKRLRESRLVNEHRLGRRHYFSLNPVGFGELREYVDFMWQDALAAFAAYVSEQTKTTSHGTRRRRKD